MENAFLRSNHSGSWRFAPQVGVLAAETLPTGGWFRGAETVDVEVWVGLKEGCENYVCALSVERCHLDRTHGEIVAGDVQSEKSEQSGPGSRKARDMGDDKGANLFLSQ